MLIHVLLENIKYMANQMNNENITNQMNNEIKLQNWYQDNCRVIVS